MRRFAALVLMLGAPVLARPAWGETEPLPPPPILISAPRADVWAALTTVEGVVATDGGQASVDLKPGGAIRRHPDASAALDDPGWTATPVLAFVAPRIPLLGGTATTWTSIELDELDALRTRVRIEHVGVRPGSKEEAPADAADRALVGRLRKRFPKRPDPVVAAFTPLAGAWEERSDAGGEVVARWTIAVEAGDERVSTEQPFVTLERKEAGDGGVDRWVFWREAESGRWIGGLAAGGRPEAWEVHPYGGGGIAWSNRWCELGPTSMSIGQPARDGVLEVERVVGCFGEGFRWTRPADTK